MWTLAGLFLSCSRGPTAQSVAASIRIHVEPARCVKPAGMALGNVKHSVPPKTHQFRAVPFQENSGGLPDPHGIPKQAEANRATLALIVQGPTEGKWEAPNQH